MMPILRGAPAKALASPEIAHTVWEENVEFANKANEPGKILEVSEFLRAGPALGSVIALKGPHGVFYRRERDAPIGLGLDDLGGCFGQYQHELPLVLVRKPIPELAETLPFTCQAGG